MKTAGKAGMNAIGKLTAERLLKRTPGPHLDTESLAAFADNALPELERTQALAHMSECAECREIVFLAHPQAAEQQGVFKSVPGRSVILFRWAAGLAAVAVVGGGVFLAKHELLHERTMTAHQEDAPRMYANVSEKKATTQRELAPAPAPMAKSESNGRPEPKHMTAKLNGTMQFDSSDQIHMLTAPAVPGPLNFQAETGQMQNGQMQSNNETGSHDLAVPAASGPSSYAFDKTPAKEKTSDATATVEVAGANTSVSVQPKAAKDSAAEFSRVNRVAAGYVGGALSKAINVPGAQWSLSPTGALQRSFDAGKSWREVLIEGTQSSFRAVFSSGTQVWVGGNAGALYHSSDSGLTWAKVTPTSADRKLSRDITHIEFADTQNGKVSTDGGEIWATTDGGQTWTPQN